MLPLSSAFQMNTVAAAYLLFLGFLLHFNVTLTCLIFLLFLLFPPPAPAPSLPPSTPPRPQQYHDLTNCTSNSRRNALDPLKAIRPLNAYCIEESTIFNN